jgi:hypothetical protein
MALKRKLTKEEHEKLSEHIKGEYIQDGEGFRLDVDGDEDTGALKRAKDREAQLRREAEAKLREAQEQLDALGTDDARKKGDIATLEKSWQTKLEAQKSEYQAKLDKLTDHTKRQLVDNVAQQLASKISTAPALLLPHIKARLTADFDGDAPLTRIMDKDGKISAMTVDDLSAEFIANKDFSAIIIGSQASGSARTKSQNTGGGAPSKPDTSADLATMNPAQLAEHIAARKA